jgi:hypothetical protein
MFTCSLLNEFIGALLFVIEVFCFLLVNGVGFGYGRKTKRERERERGRVGFGGEREKGGM